MDADGLSPGTITGVLRGAQQRNPDSLYFLGLLRLYGQGGLAEDHTKAAATILEVTAYAPDPSHTHMRNIHTYTLRTRTCTLMPQTRESLMMVPFIPLIKAAELGNVEAQCAIGMLLIHGIGLGNRLLLLISLKCALSSTLLDLVVGQYRDGRGGGDGLAQKSGP